VSSSSTNVPPASSASRPGAAGSAEGQVVEVRMPKMGISVSEGTILEWRKQPGDRVEADETIADVTTDKVDVEIPCPASGVLSKILVEAGETVAVETLIAEIGQGETAPAEPPEPTQSNGDRAQVPTVNGEADRSRFYSPVVRRIADKHHIDLDRVEGTGIGGRVRKKDLAALIERGEAAERPQPTLHTESPYKPEPVVPAADRTPAEETPEKYEVSGSALAASVEADGASGSRHEPMSVMRQAIARHMVDSRHTAAHCTTIIEVDMSRVAARRAELKEAMARRGVPLTYLAFVAEATVAALARFPILNASVDGDQIVYHDDVNLGIAVALDQGLIVPVIPKAQRLSIEGLAAAIGDVAKRAREKQLEPDDVHGGTFTITNPGQFGAVLATPIINQPQVAILDLEAIVKRAVVIEGPDGDSIAIRPITYLCMSWDHRALDGAEAARFLGTVKQRLESGGAL